MNEKCVFEAINTKVKFLSWVTVNIKTSGLKWDQYFI